MPRFIYLVLAYACLALALIGVVLPGLPTVPFLLLCACFASRGSTRLHRWLYEHPRFGQLLIDWETNRAVSRKSKVIAIAMLVASWIFMFYRVPSPWILLAITVLFVCVGIFLITRNEPQGAGPESKPVPHPDHQP